MVTPSPRVMIGGVMPGPCLAKWSHRLLIREMLGITRTEVGTSSGVRLVTWPLSNRSAEFEALRPHLMSVAYRLTGTVADAEDIVQEAWLRWHTQDNVINDLRAWLTTVVSRLGLDRLRSAAHRRETYTGNWLPEPVVTRFDADDPLSEVVARRGCPLRGDGGAGAPHTRSAGGVRAARRVRRAVRRSSRRIGNHRGHRPAARVAGPQGRNGGAAAEPDPSPQRGGRQAVGRHGRRRS